MGENWRDYREFNVPRKTVRSRRWYLATYRLLSFCSVIFFDEVADSIGIGINTTNPHPTTSLLNIIPEHLRHPTHEALLAKILSVFSDMYTKFLTTGFSSFEAQYYKRWLHTGQIVHIENGIARGKVVGISCFDGGSGGLLVDEVDMTGRSLRRAVTEVVADGNSFDMMKGLLRRKTAR